MSKAKVDQFEVNLAKYKDVVKQLVAFKSDIKSENAKQVLALLDEFYPLHDKLKQNKGLSDAQVSRQKRVVADVVKFKLPVDDVRAMSEAAKKILDAETPKPVPTKTLSPAVQAKVLLASIKASVAASKEKNTDEPTQVTVKSQDIDLSAFKSEYAKLLLKLDSFKLHINEKAINAPGRYKALNTKIGNLVTDLKVFGDNFFDKPVTAKSFEEFKSSINALLLNAEAECKNQRGWHMLHPIIKGFVGFLAAISVFPALYILKKSGVQGYVNTFFKTPDTATLVEFKVLKESIVEQENAIEAVVSPK